jgi:hypothetical protein
MKTPESDQKRGTGHSDQHNGNRFSNAAHCIHLTDRGTDDGKTTVPREEVQS